MSTPPAISTATELQKSSSLAPHQQKRTRPAGTALAPRAAIPIVMVRTRPDRYRQYGPASRPLWIAPAATECPHRLPIHNSASAISVIPTSMRRRTFPTPHFTSTARSTSDPEACRISVGPRTSSGRQGAPCALKPIAKIPANGIPSGRPRSVVLILPGRGANQARFETAGTLITARVRKTTAPTAARPAASLHRIRPGW